MTQRIAAAHLDDGARLKRLSEQALEPFAPAPQSPLSEPADEFGSGEQPAIAEQARTRIMLEAFFNAVERLESVLDQETHMLDGNRPIALHDYNHRKSYGLLELSRAMTACRALDRQTFDLQAKAPLSRLRVKLENNLASLQTHLRAVTEIASVIARAIQDHESDGTYSVGKSAKGDGA